MRLKMIIYNGISLVRTRRTFTDDFKRQIAEAIISDKVSRIELYRKYEISTASISRWN